MPQVLHPAVPRTALLFVSLTMAVHPSTTHPPARHGNGARAIGSRDPDTLATLLHHTGYVGRPFDRLVVGNGSYQVVRVQIDTTKLDLILDSGASFYLVLDPTIDTTPGVHRSEVQTEVASVNGKEPGHYSVVDRATLGSVNLQSQQALLQNFHGPTAGVVGVEALIDRRAIIDFATDSVYLLADPSPSPPAQPSPASSNFANLRLALEAAGQYRTFLALAQEAGMLGLLEGTPSDTLLDSLIWNSPRLAAIREAGASKVVGKARAELTQKMLNHKFRHPAWITAFVPTDAAFARLDPAMLRAWHADTAQLAAMIRAHLLTDTRLDSEAFRTLVSGGSQPTGSTFGFRVIAPRIDVERRTTWEGGRVLARATITQFDIGAANGAAHGIDRVLVPEPTTPLDTTLRSQGYIGIPLYRLPSNQYVVRLMVNGNPLTLCVDTGAPGDLWLDQAAAERLQLTDTQISLPFAPQAVFKADIQSTDLGVLNQRKRDRGEAPIDGLLGSEILIRYKARMDLAMGVLYLRLPTAP